MERRPLTAMVGSEPPFRSKTSRSICGIIIFRYTTLPMRSKRQRKPREIRRDYRHWLGLLQRSIFITTISHATCTQHPPPSTCSICLMRGILFRRANVIIHWNGRLMVINNSNQSRSTRETTSSEWPVLGNPYGTEAIQGHQPTAETPSSIAPKKKRGRPKKASGGSAPIFNGPPSSRDTQGLDTLVNAITADMNGGTSIDNSQPGISPSKPRKKKTKTREATQLQAPSWTAIPVPSPYSAPQPPPASAAEASSSAASPEKLKHTRKKTGCLTCRARKVRCDEQRSTCAMCAIKGRECSWAATKDDKKKSRERVIARIQAGDWHQRNKADKSKKNAK